jgi:hypothetical protein
MRPMYMHAAVASIWEVAMHSAPVSDSWDGPKRRGATGYAILGSKFFPTYSQTPSFSTIGGGGSENFFSETASALRNAAPHRL